MQCLSAMSKLSVIPFVAGQHDSPPEPPGLGRQAHRGVPGRGGSPPLPLAHTQRQPEAFLRDHQPTLCGHCSGFRCLGWGALRACTAVGADGAVYPRVGPDAAAEREQRTAAGAPSSAPAHGRQRRRQRDAPEGEHFRSSTSTHSPHTTAPLAVLCAFPAK